MQETVFKFQRQGKTRNSSFSVIPSSVEKKRRVAVRATGPRIKVIRANTENMDILSLGSVMDIWLASSAASHKRSTHSTYVTVADRHIRPALGSYAVEEVGSETLANFLKDKVYGTSGERALSSSTVCSIVTVLRSVFRYAETMGRQVNAWGALNRPKLVTNETEVLTAAEQERFEAFLLCDRSFEKLGVLVCLYTGLRLGEICALKWGDISLGDGTLTVRRTVQRIKNASYDEKSRGNKTVVVFDAPKSRRSNRTIPLPSFLVGILREQRCCESGFLLTGDAADFIEPRTFQNKFKAFLKQAGLRDINFHALRHTFATNCINLGFDPKTLSEILGHADVSVTLNTYVHPSLSKMRSYMEMLGGDGGSQNR